MTRSRFWADLRADEFRDLDLERTIAVLPLGAIEQHGPHLPVSVDRDIIDAVVQASLPHLGDLDVLFLPTQAIGKSNEHIAWPGTLTLSAHTTLSVWMDIGASVARAGVRKLVFLNAHGGNTSAMDIVARDLRAEHGLLTVSASWYSVARCEELFDDHELEHGIHGGRGETSMMLASRPDTVRMAAAEQFPSQAERWAEQGEFLGAGARAAKVGWLIEDLNPAGACGDAAGATVELGEAMVERGGQGIAALLREVDALELDRRDQDRRDDRS